MTNAAPLLDTVNDPPPIESDGRTLRRNRNRDAVIESLISLIREGDLDPTVAKIADRAAVSHRSIFRYFDDLDDLARTAIETAVSAALPLAAIPNIGEGSLEHRIDQMVSARMRILTYTHQLMRVATGRSTSLTEIDRDLSLVAKSFRDQVGQQFATEFDAMGPADAEHLVAVLSSVMSFPGYDHQSRMLDRSNDEIADAWRLTLRILFR
jgi:TetR/AcrR family transcriptional regulator of autoinduction and epiphytic fitness